MEKKYMGQFLNVNKITVKYETPYFFRVTSKFFVHYIIKNSQNDPLNKDG